MNEITRILFFVYLFLTSNGFSQDIIVASVEDDFSVIDEISKTKIINPVINSNSLKLNVNSGNIEKKEFSNKNIVRGIHKYNAPSHFFELMDWSLSVPTDEDGNGIADHVEEKELAGGYLSKYFYATDNGALVFTCPIRGFKTSKNTSYTRVELREMLRTGNTKIKTKGPTKNNWVLAASKSVKKAGGYNGELKVTLEVNHVTTTGKSLQLGRVIIGQIHAKNNEPFRLYYRKLPNNKKGSIYFAHETKNGEEDYYELIGSKSNSAENPNDGIALDEKFTYQVSLIKNKLTVKIDRPFKPLIEKVIDIKHSGYKDPEEYMYFKVGVYNQNKSGDPDDYVQATFYDFINSHQNKF